MNNSEYIIKIIALSKMKVKRQTVQVSYGKCGSVKYWAKYSILNEKDLRELKMDSIVEKV